MKRWIPWLLLLALLLTGCAGTEQSTPPNPDEAAEQSAPAEKVYTAQEAREALGAWLEQDCSFDMLFRCLSLPGQYGYEEKINQSCATDGSFTFYISARWWDKGTGVDASDRAEYHYAWEDETYVCTMRHNDEPVERIPMTRPQQEDLDQSRRQMIGVDTLLPSWAEDFRQEPVENAPELLCFRYALPLERLLREENMLSKELDIVLQLQELDTYPEGLCVEVSLCAEKESLRPRDVYYDFSELTPYVFEDWEHLPEAAEDTARMEMRFSFDFDLAETVPLPDTLRETAEGEPALPEPGVIEDGEYRQPFFGLAFPLEGWELRDREEIGRFVFGDPRYGSFSPEELLPKHMPYPELMMSRGDTEMQILLELPPITTSDGSVSYTPAEYMDADARNLPRDYASIGTTVSSDERFQTELCGMAFEGYRLQFRFETGETVMTILTTERNGVFFTIMINCVGEDETDDVLASFTPLD